eukprot:TRINITY_DN6647_c0_g1_i4.p1 TRINITY_DN6647_c0_g1~~TRINITY_DN6647_c0_g1_i4.p1  ORF type:complete len:397 (-),score=102.02 TRINITY_DN6647_c0_g1_i4:354-1544(-)
MKRISPFVFDSSLGYWVPAEEPNNSSNKHQQLSSDFDCRKLRVAALNVLHDEEFWLVKQISRPLERQRRIFSILEALGADVVCLNEVTPSFLRLLLDQKWVRERYLVSDVVKDAAQRGGKEEGRETKNGSLNHPNTFMGNLILSKLPIKHVFHYTFSPKCAPLRRGAVFVELQSQQTKRKLVVTCAHITAYQNSSALRQTQLNELIGELCKFYSSPQNDVDFILAGDLNFHHEWENFFVEKNSLKPFVDLWKKTHSSKDYNYTFDFERNRLILTKFMFMERRKMRLDRILLSQDSFLNSHWFPVSPMTIFADQPVADNGSVFSYLFPSDHFGLFVDLSNDSAQREKSVQVEEEAENAFVTEEVKNNLLLRKKNRAFFFKVLFVVVLLLLLLIKFYL